jgi:hypothetical protein
MEDFAIVEEKATLTYQPDERPSNIEIKSLNGVICVKKKLKFYALLFGY